MAGSHRVISKKLKHKVQVIVLGKQRRKKTFVYVIIVVAFVKKQESFSYKNITFK